MRRPCGNGRKVAWPLWFFNCSACIAAVQMGGVKDGEGSSRLCGQLVTWVPLHTAMGCRSTTAIRLRNRTPMEYWTTTFAMEIMQTTLGKCVCQRVQDLSPVSLCVKLTFELNEPFTSSNKLKWKVQSRTNSKIVPIILWSNSSCSLNLRSDTQFFSGRTSPMISSMQPSLCSQIWCTIDRRIETVFTLVLLLAFQLQQFLVTSKREQNPDVLRSTFSIFSGKPFPKVIVGELFPWLLRL